MNTLFLVAFILSTSLILPSVLSFENNESYDDDCHCKDKSLCAALKIGPRQEGYGFSYTDEPHWQHYDWSKLTTLSVFGNWDEKLLCYAHSKNVRVTFKIDITVSKLVDPAFRKEQITETVAKAKKLFADGVNIDVEQAVKKDSPEAKALTAFSKEMTEAFHKEIPGSQVTIDVAWAPNCVDNRCYDYAALAKVTDFLIVMSYDERSRIYGPCVAGPNSAFSTTFGGIKKFLDLGISAKKLVLGLPWYGYNYECIKFSGNTCEIKKVPYRGVVCSDAAGRQYCYSLIMSNFLSRAIGGRQFDAKSQSPFFNYKDEDDEKMHQFWYDDPESLSKKYRHGIKDLGLRGLAFWNIDCLNYTDTAKAKEETKKMWDAVILK